MSNSTPDGQRPAAKPLTPTIDISHTVGPGPPPPPQRLEERLAEELKQFWRPERVGDAQIVLSQVVQAFSGPVPPPAVMEQYDRLVPGAAERLITMAEREQTHRHAWEQSALRFDGWGSLATIGLGWLLSIGLAGGAIYCAYINQPVVAVALTTFSAAGAIAELVTAWRKPKPRPKTEPAPKPTVPKTSSKQKGRGR